MASIIEMESFRKQVKQRRAGLAGEVAIADFEESYNHASFRETSDTYGM